ncbi:hypothetical protein BH20ACI1_BH20ACI1_16170 [soil metagenome]
MKTDKFYTLITIGIISILLASCSSKVETVEPTTQTNDNSIAETIAQTDKLCQKHEDLSQLRECVNSLDRVRNPDKRNYEVEWKFAKYNYFLGKQIEKDEESEKYLEDGEEAGKIASRVTPDKPDGYFWYGANLGELAKRSPLTKGLTSVDDIRAAMKKVIEIQPDYQGASAYDALAQIELSTGLVGGKPEKAVEYLEKAIALEDNNSYLRLHLGQAYLAVNRKEDAKKQLEYVLNMKPNPDFLPEYNESVEEAKKLLKTRF